LLVDTKSGAWLGGAAGLVQDKMQDCRTRSRVWDFEWTGLWDCGPCRTV